MKLKLRRSVVAFTLLTMLVVSNIVVASAKVTTKKDDYSAYSAAGIRVCYVQLTAEGNTSKHTISNYYKSAESTAFLNSVENQTKWKSNYGKYKKANFSADHKVGVPTPWGSIGYTYKSIYLSVKF